MDTWAFGKGRTNLATLLKAIGPWIEVADGITVSGGEPFDQKEALYVLLSALRARTPADVLIYTGYAREQLKLDDFFGLIDVLITDPFLPEWPQRLALRGSDNQRLHYLTDVGARRFSEFDRERRGEDDRLDLCIDDAGTAWLTGIPKRGDVARLLKILRSHGHEAYGTFDARGADSEDNL